jgi:SAM-dependent methyltransferase
MDSYICDVQLEEKACPLGCPLDDEKIVVGRDRLHDLPGMFTVVKCCTCGLMRTNPRPTPKTMGLYYPDEYGPYKSTLVRAGGQDKVQTLLRQLVRHVFRFNTHALPKIEPGRMLEIGCGSGAFLHHMAKKGWNVEGLEFSETAASAARSAGYTVSSGTLETAQDPEDSYDLIVGWMTLEHLHDPLAALKKLHSWMKPDGWMITSIPNAASLGFTLFRESWYDLHLPNHLYHFTPRTLDKMLDIAGWRIEKVLHQRVSSNLVASIGLKARDTSMPKWLSKMLLNTIAGNNKLNYLLYPLSYPLSLLGQTGRMTVWARPQ